MKTFFYMVLTLLSFSAASNQCASWGCLATIETLYTTVDGDIYIGTPSDEKLAKCTPVSGVYFTLNPASGNAKEVYSSILTAYMANKKIQLRIKEGSSNCELAYVKLTQTL
jgi:hypothetical protein